MTFLIICKYHPAPPLHSVAVGQLHITTKWYSLRRWMVRVTTRIIVGSRGVVYALNTFSTTILTVLWSTWDRGYWLVPRPLDIARSNQDTVCYSVQWATYCSVVNYYYYRKSFCFAHIFRCSLLDGFENCICYLLVIMYTWDHVTHIHTHAHPHTSHTHTHAHTHTHTHTTHTALELDLSQAVLVWMVPPQTSNSEWVLYIPYL